MKICKDCGKKKDESEFYGVQSECKDCTKKRVRVNYQKRIKYYKRYEKERNQRPERKAKQLEYSRKRRSTFKGKYKANNAVNNALRDGRLKKQPCEVCGSRKSEAHHPDYRSHLKVKWLCQRHHRELHD